MTDAINRIAAALEESRFVEMEASGRHVHLTEAAAMTLFGHGLTNKLPLSQPGQYVCVERVTLQGPKGAIERVAVLGPARKENQVELSLTDAVTLGIKVPVRLSGDMTDAAQVTVIGEKGQLTCGAIAAKRHIHLRPQDAERYGVSHCKTLRIQAFTDRPVIFDDVAVRISSDFAPRVHLDFDEANACHFKKGDLGLILRG